MKNTSEQREALLREARMHHSSMDIPAIHPRYRAVYRNLYPEESSSHPGTLRTRILICLVLFALYAALDQGNFPKLPVTSSQISLEISTPFRLSLY